MRRALVLLFWLVVSCLSQTPSASPLKVAAPPNDKPKAEAFSTYEDYVDALTNRRILRTARMEVTGPKLAAIEIAALKQEIARLDHRVDDLQKTVSKNRMDGTKYDVATFDPAELNSYGRIDTGAGTLLVVMGKAEPYLDGYKVQLRIGNPLSVNLRGFTVSTIWGPRYRAENDYAIWLGAQSQKTFSFTGDLAAAQWTTCDLILLDTKPERFGIPCTKPKDVKNGKTCWANQFTDLNSLAGSHWEVVSQSGAAPRACPNMFSADCPEYHQSITFVFRRENKQ